MKAKSSEHSILKGMFILLMRGIGGKSLSEVKQHSRMRLLLSNDHQKMKKGCSEDCRKHQNSFSLPSCCYFGLNSPVFFLTKYCIPSFIERVAMEYNRINLLSLTSLTDLNRRRIENVSHYKVV